MNRRSFVKLAGAALASAALPPSLTALAQGERPLPLEDTFGDAFVPLRRGRVQASSVAIYNTFEYPRSAVKRIRRDGVLLLGEEVQYGNSYNNTWYRTRGGWVPSGWIQPMEFHSRPQIYLDVGRTGSFWVEVIQVKTTTRKGPSFSSEKSYEFIYGTVYLVTDVTVDATGSVWYNTYDEYADREEEVLPTNHWVQAKHVRRIHESEFTAIRPWVTNKRMDINLKAQTLTCFEGDVVVLHTKCATGASFTQIDGTIADFATPDGEHQVILKQPTRHMRAIEGERETDGWFDLPGVPWSTFFTYEGIAIHGTYWHNDYGVVRSHGCVNVPIQVAKFIYRWTFPTAPYNDAFVRGDVRGMDSTQIMVV